MTTPHIKNDRRKTDRQKTPATSRTSTPHSAQYAKKTHQTTAPRRLTKIKSLGAFLNTYLRKIPKITPPNSTSFASLRKISLKNLIHQHLYLSLTLTLIGSFLVVRPIWQTMTSTTPEVHASAEKQTETQSAQTQTVATEQTTTQQPTPAFSEQSLTVHSGDTVSNLFKTAGQSTESLYEVLKQKEIAKALRTIHVGQTLTFTNRNTGANPGALDALSIRLDPVRTLQIQRQPNGTFALTEHHETVDTKVKTKQASITQSLYQAAHHVGLSDTMVLQLADIFVWDIDFAQDLREGDQFTVVYEEQWLNGKKWKDGKILAAQFVNQGKTYQAVAFAAPNQKLTYYTPEGKSLQKAFLRTPVDFARISSGFTLARWHPILHTMRAHRGVDYAAARGTPVKAAGDGKIAFAGFQPGYGRTIILQHRQPYETLYGHLNGFRGNLRAGQTIKQGEIIGYVGSTGLATGPHLHYEFRVNHVQQNPLTITLPNAEPLTGAARQQFALYSGPLLEKLHIASSRDRFAVNTPRSGDSKNTVQ